MSKSGQITKTPSTAEESSPPAPQSHHSRVGVTWLTMTAFAIILLLLIIFILQNNNDVAIKYFGWSGSIPFGISMVLAALVGAILTLLIGSIRILQLKIATKKN